MSGAFGFVLVSRNNGTIKPLFACTKANYGSGLRAAGDAALNDMRIAVNCTICRVRSLVPDALMFYGGYTHVGDEKIVGEAPGRNRIQDGGFANMLISTFTKILTRCLSW